MLKRIISYAIAFGTILLIMCLVSLIDHSNVLNTYFSSVVNCLVMGFASIAVLAGFAGLILSIFK